MNRATLLTRLTETRQCARSTAPAINHLHKSKKLPYRHRPAG